ncbi:bifunctional DNA primase/polymerase [Streptomyces avicenniae]|uniref:bifunctional DNA primase/polymerase n=1 Tax=Streptomyces avicenniae TaxID=500153 RepID=UPI000699B901|nr:bifunctional DNA primase/polymerase [Streptomyces avicenniae]
MENSIGVTQVPVVAPPLAKIPLQRAASLVESAVRYTAECHWDVFPGTWLEDGGGVLRCSCAVPRCGAPGAHPTRPDWTAQATGSATAARRLWTEEPRAALLLPTGRVLDVVEVPEAAGCLALARMERTAVTLGPVSVTPSGRMQFFVRPGGAAQLPGLLRRTGWAPVAGAMGARGEGDYVVAAPTRMGTRGGSVQWVRHPTTANRWLPEAADLVPALAYACGQDER